MHKRPARFAKLPPPGTGNGDLDMQVVFDPSTGDTDYRPVVPYGTSWTAEVVFVSANGPFLCTAIMVEQGDNQWFTTGWTEKLVFRHQGITCTISTFSSKGLMMVVENKNDSGTQIVLHVTPQFSDGSQTWKGTDPQIVLPPEKEQGPWSAESG